MKLRLLLGPALIVGALLAPSAASASFIVYGCGDNLCRVAPDGSARRQVTTDGTASANYHWPSLSTDGRRMSWLRRNDVMLGDASGTVISGPFERTAWFDRIRPDGTQVAALIQAGGLFALYAHIYGADGTHVMSGPEPSLYSLGWSADQRHLLLPWDNPDGTATGICEAVEDPTGVWFCGTIGAYSPVAVAAGVFLSDPAVSPNGHTLAVTVLASRSDAAGHIALYNYDTHAFVRNLTSGTTDALPQWSPDGSTLVFQRARTSGGPSLYTTVATAKPGQERLLIARGETPTWGGALDPAATGLRLTGNQRGTTVRSRLTIRLGNSSVDARLIGTGAGLSGKLLGKTMIARSPAGGRAVTVGLNSAGRAALKRKGALRLRLQIRVRPPVGITSTVTGTLTLRK